jgi:flagellar motor switch protein FliG
MSTASMTGRQKAAAFLISLGPENASELLKRLGEREVEALTAEMANLARVQPDTLAMLHDEFAERLAQTDLIAIGGMEFAREVLEKSVGRGKADEIIGGLTQAQEMRPFDFLRRTPPEQICAFLADESPQTIALVIASLHSSLAARVLAELQPAVQSDVALRIATMTETNPEVIRDLEVGLKEKLANVLTQEMTAAGGVESLAEILNQAGRSTEKNVLEAMAESDGMLADQVRARLFTFDDLVMLTDRDIQLLLREVDQKELALALRGVANVVRDKLLTNMSSRGAELLREDIETQPPQRKQVVEEAQSKIVGAVRRLEDSGAITIGRGGEDPDDEVV